FYLPPVDYTVDIEVSLMDSSFLEQVKKYFQNLELPVSINISNVEVTVSNISVTTVCRSSGENDSCCSCEDGYTWPREVCSDLVPCPSASLASDQTCSYMKGMLSQRPYCEPQTKDSCGMGEPIEMQMSVRLNIDFHDDLRNSSSELYKKYKADLETAFNASYRCLPGFVSAAVSGFSPGSVFVDYIVKAGTASFEQISGANKILSQSLDGCYQPNTFTTKVIGQTNFTVSPEDIFEGDRVRLICEINSTSENVTWRHNNDIISNHLPDLTDRNTSRSILEIANVTMENSGSYSCSFKYRNNEFCTLIYRGRKKITVSQLNITSYISNDNVICNSPEMQINGPVLSCCIDKPLSSLTVDWKVNGEVNMTGVSSFRGNCTEYKLNINESLCSPEKSGTVTTYTCELQTGHGARSSANIQVTYFWAARVAIPLKINSTVLEGHEFSLTCESDVSNYDKISWKIQSGNNTTELDCGTCIANTKNPARSVLTVKKATEKWNGTYTCTFFQKFLNSSAEATINVIPFPVQQNILIDPIVASIPCKAQLTLQCCINATLGAGYNVKFVVREKEFQYAQNRSGALFCYMYNYTETECRKDKNFTAHCKFINSIGQNVNSKNITLNAVSGKTKKVSCSDSLGIGIEGGILVKPCCGSNCTDGFTQGSKTYKCSNKLWKPQRDDCLSVAINTLLSDAKSLVNDPERNKILPDYLEYLNKKMREDQIQTNRSANLGAIIDILGMVSVIPAEARNSTIENFLSIVDYIVENSTDNVWKDLNEGEGPGSSSLMKSVENFTLNLQPVNNIIPTVSVNTLQIQGIAVTENSTDYNKTFCSTKNLTVGVFLSNMDVQTLTQNSTIVSVMYSKLGAILPRNKTQYVNGLLITTTVSSNRSQKIDINMIFKKENSALTSPKCVFWNFMLNEPRGSWDTQGCAATSEDKDYVNCSCNHLTSFSILMSPDTNSQTEAEYYITYIGLAISILSLVICIIIESLAWKYVTNNTTSYMRHVCMLNIATSLLIADIWFIVTFSIISDQNQQMNKAICSVATFFIHLFYLCVFFWMLSLGLILFYRLVFILHNTSKTTQKAVAFCLGYGCPFVIAVITIAVTLPRKSYTRKDFCWLNWNDSKALLAFVIPALIIVVMNLFITAVVIIKILRPTIGDRSNRQERKSLLQIGKSVAILTPLLGLTWGFGLAITTNKSHQAFHILFSLFNTLQGFFILVFGTLWDKKIQEALLKRNSMSKWSSQQTKVRTL
ncbi:AGRF5 protein, partial [Nycticryphes semicollaris]|nr:AGRF5 protein [Nycticryphes semicollaris]